LHLPPPPPAAHPVDRIYPRDRTECRSASVCWTAGRRRCWNGQRESDWRRRWQLDAESCCSSLSYSLLFNNYYSYYFYVPYSTETRLDFKTMKKPQLLTSRGWEAAFRPNHQVFLPLTQRQHEPLYIRFIAMCIKRAVIN